MLALASLYKRWVVVRVVVGVVVGVLVRVVVGIIVRLQKKRLESSIKSE